MASVSSASSPVQLPEPFTLGSLVRVQFATSVYGPGTVEGILSAVDTVGICLSNARLGDGQPPSTCFIAWAMIAYLKPHPQQPSDQPDDQPA